MTTPTAGSGPTHPPGHPGTGHPPPPPPPPPRDGHLPIAPECDCGHGDLEQMWHLAPCPRARPMRTPTLGMVIRDAERTLRQAIQILGRQWDPASGPQQDGGVLPSDVDRGLSAAMLHANSALEDLAHITILGLPPAGSAVQFAARRTPSACLPGGSSSHLAPPSPGVSGGRTPGLVDAASRPATGGTDESAAPGAGADFSLPQAKRWTA